MTLNSSNVSLTPVLRICYLYSSGSIIFPVYTFSNALLLHLHILVLYVVVKRRRSRGSGHGAVRPSHGDLFAFHMIILEGIGVGSLVLFSCGISTGSHTLQSASLFMFCLYFPGLTLLDCLTCVERYLAVVHPMIYRRRQHGGAARVRNLSIALVWLQCFVCVGIAAWYQPYFPTIPFLFLLVFSIVSVSYCSLSILRVLVRPGPGDAANRTKQRAFRITVVILGMLLLRFLGLFLCFGLVQLVVISENMCLLMNCGIWLTLPSNLVLPLLLLHRAGMRACCGQRPESE